jgi:hypothetical protein
LQKKGGIKMGNVVEKCLGNGFDEDHKKFHNGGACNRIIDGKCAAYAMPELKWDRGPMIGYCPLATHYDEALVAEKPKGRVGQQKGKKGKRNR